MKNEIPATEHVRAAVRTYRVHPEEFDAWLNEVRATAVELAAERLVLRDQFSERTLTILDDLADEIRGTK